MWKWNQYLYSKIPVGKIPLNISLDETSIALWQPRHRGNVSVRKNSLSRTRSKIICNVTLKAQRSSITHVAMCCDRPEIQPLLPQFLLANRSVLRKRDIPLVIPCLPRNVFLIRGKSSWSSKESMETVLRKLADILRDVRDIYQPIIFFDTAPSHLHASLFDILGRELIFVGLVPANLTWLLQVLDAAVFAHFKRFFKSRFHAKRADVPAGQLSIVDVIEVVVLSIRKVLCGRCWRDAFVSLGFHASYDNISSFVLTNLQWQQIPHIVTCKPTEMEMQCVWPANRRPHYNEMFRWIDPDTSILALLPPVLIAATALPAAPRLLALPAPSLPSVPDAAPSAQAAAPRVCRATPTSRRRTLPPSFAQVATAASSSRDHADALETHLRDAAGTYAWINDGRVRPR